ncbi:tubulin epsilon chain-like [Uloborus diversus]|uniref:tubulin epsilon chain-like n=1 Tax=Uloborus diversus TaxID=327109 RepID=UPI002409EA65|nr:tubulin epsilon chain-like [Uloborus diversus]
MPQSIFVQVGQCGNQIGCRFWDIALQEFLVCKKAVDDIEYFFKPNDVHKDSEGRSILDGIKARAVLIDMEEGVISETLRGPLKDLFSHKQLVTDVSGSGNNWAVGNMVYGPKYQNDITALFRKEAEACDSLQCFYLIHSVGGGTGSGLGTAVLEYLYHEFPKVPRFVSAVFPSLVDDVITSPYNTVLANSKLIEFASCVIPFENKALTDICVQVSAQKSNQAFFLKSGKSKLNDIRFTNTLMNVEKRKPFDEMNNIVANTLINLTCSSRFPGSLNIDVNEIVTNMVPFRKLHYIAVLIDMEEGVISETLRGPLKDLFSHKQLVTDVSGSGNNWAVGNMVYGPKYQNDITALFRKEAEACDSLQCFYLIHSVGGDSPKDVLSDSGLEIKLAIPFVLNRGPQDTPQQSELGTGSGLGTAVLEYLYHEFPKVPRFVSAVFPSLVDDVITSPYNTVLANSKLIEFASCVIPFENKALTDICVQVSAQKSNQAFFLKSGKSKLNDIRFTNTLMNVEKRKPFDEMNNIVANTLINLTCSSRFPGSLNIDVNEIVTNMVPFRKLHYIVPSLSPLFSLDTYYKLHVLFQNSLSPDHQLFPSPLEDGIVFASTLICRGDILMSDVQSTIDRLKADLKFPSWNDDAWKIGLCKIPHFTCPQSVLLLANTSSISKYFTTLRDRFSKMFQKKAHLHHFLEVQNMERDIFTSSLANLTSLIEEYENEATKATIPLPSYPCYSSLNI